MDEGRGDGGSRGDGVDRGDRGNRGDRGSTGDRGERGERGNRGGSVERGGKNEREGRGKREESEDDAHSTVEPLQMSDYDLLEVDEEYSIAYQITNLAPTTTKEAIEYYNSELPKNLYKAEEQAVIHLALAKIYVMIIVSDDENELSIYKNRNSKPDIIDKCLRHLRKAISYFTYDVYPLVFATICVLTAQSLRHQYMEITRSKIPVNKRVTARADVLRKGIDLLYESCGVFAQSKRHAFEYTISALDAGFLRLLQIENNPEMSESDAVMMREYAIINLEEAAQQLDLAGDLGSLSLPKHAVLLLAGIKLLFVLLFVYIDVMTIITNIVVDGYYLYFYRFYYCYHFCYLWCHFSF